LTDAVLLIAWGALAVDSLLLARRERQRAALGRVVTQGWHPRSAVQAPLLAIAVAEAAVVEVWSGRVFFRPVLAVAGLGLVVAGLVLHARARRALGPFWTGIVQVRAGQPIVQYGPYARVRHPIYLAVLLLVIGSLAAHVSVATACLAVGLAAGLALKIRVEERALRGVLGEAYDRYAERVPALVPRWSAPRVPTDTPR
jgi:protein-S-isoprenylcysteine O-methyltransferase Ste14